MQLAEQYQGPSKGGGQSASVRNLLEEVLQTGPLELHIVGLPELVHNRLQHLCDSATCVTHLPEEVQQVALMDPSVARVAVVDAKGLQQRLLGGLDGPECGALRPTEPEAPHDVCCAVVQRRVHECHEDVGLDLFEDCQPVLVQVGVRLWEAAHQDLEMLGFEVRQLRGLALSGQGPGNLHCWPVLRDAALVVEARRGAHDVCQAARWRHVGLRQEPLPQASGLAQQHGKVGREQRGVEAEVADEGTEANLQHNF
mmetsp:Transcript_4263/g.12757  ORF Transcript_4263/g.12757 Transcript_4263/m.12757 type:complete len:255 (-) Transcript_4263:485-1249(-)